MVFYETAAEILIIMKPKLVRNNLIDFYKVQEIYIYFLIF